MAETRDFDVSESASVQDKDGGIEVHPLAFTIQFHDGKVDENKQLKMQERLSTFAFKHRRNPSLPDFGIVKNDKDNLPTENSPSCNTHHASVLSKALQKSVTNSDNIILKHWEDKVKFNKIGQSKLSPLVLRKSSVLSKSNGVADNFYSYLKQGRRSSLNDNVSHKISCQDLPVKVEFNLVEKIIEKHNVDDSENKSDTVSEAGTYTVDKEENSSKDSNKKFEPSDEESEIAKENLNFHHEWINDWVSKVAEQNFLHSVNLKSNISKSAKNEDRSAGRSKIPSPVSTLTCLKGRKLSDEEKLSKVHGNHRRSSSLSAKDYNDGRTFESALETESFLRTTEFVMTEMQNRMKLSLDGKNSEPQRSGGRREHTFKEKPHPPSTASDTDTNSESDGKIFKKPLGNPFTSARLNRAFSLRRAKADPDNNEILKKKVAVNGKEGDAKRNSNSARSTPSPNSVKSKFLATSPFSRTDCGRYSMRSSVSAPRFSSTNSNQKKDLKKPNANGRSNSSLSPKEVEFQNWKRRKSFDPMKAAAEGRKKELAKKAALTSQGIAQSINVGIRTRGGNPVLRSASFHSTPQTLGSEEEEEDEPEQTSTDDREESVSSWVSNQPSLPRNSPTRSYLRNTLVTKPTPFSSRCSLSSVVSETHSSPSHQVRSEVLDNLVMTAINDLSYKLKFKSCTLLKKLHYVYEADEERSLRLQNEIAMLENRRDSNSNSPIHQSTSRNLSNTLKNLKSMENFLRILEEVLFDENLEVLVDS